MNLKKSLQTLTLAAAGAGALMATTVVQAQGTEQFFPLLVYRTGPYAPNGTPVANGSADYLKYVNAKGGMNGVKASWEECEFGYATDRGVECYERLKGKGATVVQPLSTGVTFALTEKVTADKVPLLTMGYGLAASQDGNVFKWNFPLLGTYWTAADVIMQHLAKKEGGYAKLKGKKIALVYHDSPYGKEPISYLQESAATHGFELQLLPVTHPGVEQKATWLQIRQSRPDNILLWGWGVMNSTALKEAVATGYPREKMYGVWWAGAEPDVKDVGDAAKGYNSVTLQHGAEPDAKIIKDILATVHDKGQGTGPRDEVGQVLYTRGVVAQMLAIEGVKRAQEKYGKKVMTGEQVRWGLENLALDQKKLDALGFGGVLRPISTSCADHMGSNALRVQTWNGSKWEFSSDWYQADQQVIKPLVKRASDKYATDKKIQRRDAADCSA